AFHRPQLRRGARGRSLRQERARQGLHLHADRADRAAGQRALDAAELSTEFELIEEFLKPFPRGRAVAIGPGSDCAALSVAPGMQLVATTDAVVEGVHFDLRRFSPEDVGWKALAVNLSDLAAAGARPRWFLCALAVPRTSRTTQIARRISRGMAPLARQSGCALVGGNVTRASEWSVTITALGEARRPLSRDGARPGDALVVVGSLGDAAAGLRPDPAPESGEAAQEGASRRGRPDGPGP